MLARLNGRRLRGGEDLNRLDIGPDQTRDDIAAPSADRTVAGGYSVNGAGGAHYAAPISVVAVIARRWRRGGLRRFTRPAMYSRPSRRGIQISPPHSSQGSPCLRYRAAVRCEILCCAAHTLSRSYSS